MRVSGEYSDRDIGRVRFALGYYSRLSLGMLLSICTGWFSIRQVLGDQE